MEYDWLTYFERCLRLRHVRGEWSGTLIVPAIGDDGELVRLNNKRARVTKTDIPISDDMGQELSALVETSLTVFIRPCEQSRDSR